MSVIESVQNQLVHVLIAEDSATQAQRLKYTLEQQGYQVSSAVNGRQALEMARAQKPSVVITDIVMPEMDGYQVCHAIKSDPNLKDVPVILVTTLADPQDVIRGLECRADNFIVKPYNEQYLLSRIQFVLLNHELHDSEKSGSDVEIHFNGNRHVIAADRMQILNLLLSTYDAAIQRNHELNRTKDELRKSNASLESTNKELEAFSYSVSHDLRAPLRAIDGFSQSLLEGYAKTLDEEGNDLLTRVRSNCQRMGQLIDDLLNLSRVTRGDLSRNQVDLGSIAKSILADLGKTQPQRQVTFKVADDAKANADARLMRVALENLLGNAWKFTSKQAQAVIEFGMMHEGEQQVFFVRDNGAGFDMNYAGKLFGAFQRLHSTAEFPGTGVGLATVQRIISRHGGRIWAQSKVGAGTTFFFTVS